MFSENYTPNNTTAFDAADRLFVVGNGANDTNRSNALTILKNGNTGLGVNNTTPSATLDVVGSFQYTDTNQAAGKVLTSDANGNATWQTVTSGGSGGEFQSIGGVIQNITAVATDDFVFGSTQLDNDTSGADDGKRIFFDKSQGAFRAGSASNVAWDNANVGLFSTAFGENATASGESATAMGTNTVASGISATSMGTFTIASGNQSTAMGLTTRASGNQSTAMGFSTRASGHRSTAMGSSTTAPSFVETAIGIFSENYTPNSATAFNSNDRLFVVGNGATGATRSNALTILKNGNTGIGTSSPDRPLTIQTTTGGLISFKDNVGATQWHLRTQGSGNGDLGFTESGVADDRLVLAAGGNIGIGTATPTRGRLTIEGDSDEGIMNTTTHLNLTETEPGDAVRVAFNNSNHNNQEWMLLARATPSVNSQEFNISYNSNDILKINGGGYAEITGRLGVNISPLNYAIELPNSGFNTLGRGRANAWVTYSDGRVKSNQKLLEDGLAKILKIAPKSYFHHASEFSKKRLNIKNEGENTIGFIAQELYQILPEAVQKPKDESSNLWSVDYNKIVPVAVKAIQELNAKNEALENEIKQLELQLSKYDDLQRRIEALEQK